MYDPFFISKKKNFHAFLVRFFYGRYII